MVFVLGGARSGKSSWALRYIEERYDSYLFLATARILDEEMDERVKLHKESRGPKWQLIEEPIKVAEVFETKPNNFDVVLMDCLTVWLSNIMLELGEGNIKEYQDRLLQALSERKQGIIIVSNEVGTGIVPEYPLGRRFRDIAGLLNQRVAAPADKVVFMVAGLPLYLKGDKS